MSGLDEILNLIETQQQQGEELILKAAKSKAAAIKAEGDKKAQSAYEDFMYKAKEKTEKDFENACNSTDADMKRRILACKVSLIDQAVEKIIEKLDSLPDNDYFQLIIKLAKRHSQPEKGVIHLCSKDLARVPDDFESKLNECIKPNGGSISLSKETADIDDGFILSYGLISENCSFRAVIESEKDEIRDTIARVLFR